jgi:hypothetical protein
LKLKEDFLAVLDPADDFDEVITTFEAIRKLKKDQDKLKMQLAVECNDLGSTITKASQL